MIGGDLALGGGGGGFGGFDYAALVNAVAPGAAPIVPNDTFGSLFSSSGSGGSSLPFGSRVDAWLGLDDKTKAGLKSSTADIGKLTGLSGQSQQSQQQRPQMPGAPAASQSRGSPPTELLQLIQALQQRKEQQKFAYLSQGYPVRSVPGLLGSGAG